MHHGYHSSTNPGNNFQLPITSSELNDYSWSSHPFQRIMNLHVIFKTTYNGWSQSKFSKHTPEKIVASKTYLHIHMYLVMHFCACKCIGPLHTRRKVFCIILKSLHFFFFFPSSMSSATSKALGSLNVMSSPSTPEKTTWMLHLYQKNFDFGGAQNVLGG